MNKVIALDLGYSVEGNCFMHAKPGRPPEKVSNFIAWVTKSHKDYPRAGRVSFEVVGRLASGEDLPPIIVSASQLDQHLPLWEWANIGDVKNQARAFSKHKRESLGSAIKLYSNYVEKVTGEDRQTTTYESRLRDYWATKQPEEELGVTNVFLEKLAVPRLNYIPVKKTRETYLLAYIFRLQNENKAILRWYPGTPKGCVLEVLFEGEEILRVRPSGRPWMESHSIPREVAIWISTISQKVPILPDSEYERVRSALIEIEGKPKYLRDRSRKYLFSTD